MELLTELRQNVSEANRILNIVEFDRQAKLINRFSECLEKRIKHCSKTSATSFSSLIEDVIILTREEQDTLKKDFDNLFNPEYRKIDNYWFMTNKDKFNFENIWETHKTNRFEGLNISFTDGTPNNCRERFLWIKVDWSL